MKDDFNLILEFSTNCVIVRYICYNCDLDKYILWIT